MTRTKAQLRFAKEFARRVVVARVAADLTQCQLAAQLGVSYQQVGKMERGESVPLFPTVARACRVLGIDYQSVMELGAVDD